MEEADIEELCTVCEPLPADDPDMGLVTIYPMKVERKKARKELDSVNAIEWRTPDDRKRFFLLVRRPEGGQYLIPLATHAGYSMHMG
jgi:A/G-specific adenine glycosylase